MLAYIAGAVALVPAESAGVDVTGKVVETDELGEYALEGLQGHVKVGVHFSGVGARCGAGVGFASLGNQQVFDVAPGDSYRGVDFTLPSADGRRVSGRAGPAPDGPAAVTLFSREHPEAVLRRTVLGDDGTFRFEHVAPGVYVIGAAGPAAMLVNGGSGGPLGKNPVFGDVEVQVAQQDVSGASLALQPGRPLAFQLDTGALRGTGARCADQSALLLGGNRRPQRQGEP